MSSSSRGTEATLTRRVRQQRTVADLGNLALECADLDRLFREATDAVATALEADSCALLEVLPGDGRFLLREGYGWDDGVVDETTVPADGDSQAGYTLVADGPVVVDDLQADDRVAGSEVLREHDVASGVSAVVGTDDEPWGVLGVHATAEQAFDETDATFVESVANVLATAVERDRADRRRDQQATLTETILETSPVGITLVDADGMNVFANDRAEELFGRSLEELRTYVHDDERWNLVDEHGEPLSGEELPYARVEETGEPVYDEVLGIDQPDGTRVWLSAHCAPLFDDGSFDGAVYALEDVTERKERERQLQRDQRIVETVNDGVYVTDEEGEFVFVNDAFVSMSEHTRAELLGSHGSAFFGQRFVDTDEEEWQELVGGERDSVAFETTITGPDGDTRVVHNKFVLLEVGEQLGRVGVTRDVTERKQVEADLRESEAQFRALAENLEEIVWLAEDDPEELTYINPTYEDVFGRSRESLYDDPLSFLEVVHPDDRERVREAYTALPDRVFDEEYRLERDDGETRWVHTRAVPVTDDEGTVTRIVGIDSDVTERTERERALEESEQRARTLIEHFPSGAVGLYDDELRYTLVGGERIDDLDATQEQLIGMSIYERFDEETVADLEPKFRAALAGEQRTFEFEYGGRELHVQTLPVRNAEDEVFAGMLVVQDVTERNEYRRRLEESNERLEQFAYAASHDLQEPLRMVSSYLQLIENRYAADLDEDGREFLEYAVDGADRMREMIDGLLEFSRIETRGESLEPLDLEDVLADVRRDLGVRIEESDAEITADSMPWVEGDGNQLRQVFQNLLSNAIEYSGDEPPRIDISASREGEEWVISVSDEGIGIDPEDADRIFGIFQRLHAVDEGSGSGIGLALCERIVERHGGEIWVDSEPGEGTTISFTLAAATGRNDSSEMRGS